MFGHQAVHLSTFAHTQRTLGFLRHQPATLRASGEEEAHFWWIAQHDCDVQPIDATKVFNTKLIETYGMIYTVTINGDVDVQRMDRTYVDGAYCVVERVFKWGGHTELTLGSTEPGDF